MVTYSIFEEGILEKLEFIDSKFRLAILAAKRAKQLVHGARKKIDTTADNPLTIALDEIYEGKINFQVLAREDMALEKDELRSASSSSQLLLNSDEAVEGLILDDDDDDDDDNDDDDDDDDNGDDDDDDDDESDEDDEDKVEDTESDKEEAG
jgi:DNA-directed RNA polymerase omega subunit